MLNSPTPTTPPARPARVLQVITHLSLGGAERVAFTLIRALQPNFDFAIFAVEGQKPGDVGQAMRAEADALQIPVFTGSSAPSKFGGILLSAHALARAVKSFQPDIIHLHTEIPESAYAIAAFARPALRRIPLVRTIHNSVYWNPRRWLGCWCERRMPNPLIAAVSQPAIAAFEEVRRQSKVPPPSAPPVLIPNGVSVPPLPPRQRKDTDPVRILFAARFEPQKGADLLPQIIQQVALPAGTRIELDIFGSGTHAPEINQLAAAPPPNWKITVAPPQANLSSRMNQYDLMLMPSRYEGLSLLAIESLMQSLPVVATTAPGLREGFPQDYPWLTNPNNAQDYSQLLTRILATPLLWPQVAQKARDFANQNFAVETMAGAYAQLYALALA